MKVKGFSSLSFSDTGNFLANLSRRLRIISFIKIRNH